MRAKLAGFPQPVAFAMAQPASPAARPAGAPAADARLAKLKADVVAEVEARRELTQQMVDSVFSFSEIGYQEFETQRYLSAILERNGFRAADVDLFIPHQANLRIIEAAAKRGAELAEEAKTPSLAD